MQRNPTFRSGRLVVDYDHVETRGVLAGAYRGRDIEARPNLTHLVFVGPTGSELRTGCRVDNLVDTYGHDRAFLASRPTCPTCAAKWEKIPSELRGRVEPNPSPDHSEHPTAVEYAWHSVMRGKSPAAAAKFTEKKLSGSENLFFGGEIVRIDPVKLEAAIWKRLAERVIDGLPKVRPGKEEYVLDGVLQGFQQSPALREKLRARVIDELGRDPFSALSPNGGYYVWVIGTDGEPLLEGPYGPHELETAKSLARIGATKGEHDRVVSRGVQPTAPSFEVVRQYKAGSGERVL